MLRRRPSAVPARPEASVTEAGPGSARPIGEGPALLEPTLLARLEAPRASNLYYLRFAPDGSQLFALEWDQQIQVWDLRRVHAELRKLGLDWNSPPFPQETASSRPDSEPLHISVVAGAAE